MVLPRPFFLFLDKELFMSDTSRSLKMQGAIDPQIQLSQRLIMSAQMQQAIHLLQLPLLELESFVEEQVVCNPLLEMAQEDEGTKEIKEEDGAKEQIDAELVIDENDLAILNHLEEQMRDHFDESEPMKAKRSSQEDELKTYQEQSIYVEKSLQEHLLMQAHEVFESREKLEVAEIIIGYIDSKGFIKTPLEEICTFHHLNEAIFLEVLKEIQSFDPYGVAASSTKESLLIQLRCKKKEDSIAYAIILNHYDALLHNQIPSIQKALKYPYETIIQVIENDIAKLDLHPGSHFSREPVQPIVPDVTLRQEGDQLVVDARRDYLPSLYINHRYLKMLNDPEASDETKHFIKHHFFSAKWLFRNIQHRFSTLERIAQSLCQRQYAFFMHAEGLLVPLTMKTVAEELGVHESTVARTVSNKYIATPRGLFPLKSFFTAKYSSSEGDISATTVKDAVARIVAQEDKIAPFSDEKISQLLKEQGFACARRTVAKYRTLLQIANAQQRKKYQST